MAYSRWYSSSLLESPDSLPEYSDWAESLRPPVTPKPSSSIGSVRTVVCMRTKLGIACTFLIVLTKTTLAMAAHCIVVNTCKKLRQKRAPQSAKSQWSPSAAHPTAMPPPFFSCHVTKARAKIVSQTSQVKKQ